MNRNLAENIFLTIGELISVTELIFSRASLSAKLRQLGSSGFDSYNFNRSLKRYCRNNFIQAFNKNDQIFYRLTEKGFKKLTSYKYKKSFLTANEKWDGLWRLVIFDIPEGKKLAREALRWKLKQFNFFPLQKSVFVFPFKCEKEIRSLADFFKVGEYVEIILAKSLGSKEKELKNLFGL